MNILDRHILKSVFTTALASVALFAFVLAAGNVLRDLLGPLLAGQLPLESFGRLVLLLIPFVVSYALPLGMLTGVLLTLGRLSSDSEITAMRAAGLSLPRIARPALLLALVGVLIALRVNFESMPWARVQYHKELATAVRANPLSYLRPKTFIREFPGAVVYVGSVDASSKDGSNVGDFWFWQLDSQRRVVRFVRAESGRVEYDEGANEFIVTLSNARVAEFDRRAPDDFAQPLRISTVGQFDPFRLSLSKYFGSEGVHQKIQWMTYGELLGERARIEREPVAAAAEMQHRRDLMRVSVTIQDKINMALAVFSFALVGVPLGIKVSRRETSANLGIAVVLALAYYFLIVVVGWLDQHPEYRPDLLLWVPNAIFLATGVWLLRRLDRA
ncbi:MAG: LptF/LptG family permease [Opitutaceae bacterium]